MAYGSYCDCQLKFKSLNFCFNQTAVTPLFHSENLGKTQISHMNTLVQFPIRYAPERIYQYDAQNNFKNCVFIVKKKKYKIFISVTVYSSFSLIKFLFLWAIKYLMFKGYNLDEYPPQTVSKGWSPGWCFGVGGTSQISAWLEHPLKRTVESYLYCSALGVKSALLCALCSWQEVQPLSKSQR